ncbi:lipocalin family protein [Tamlana sp. 2_MG-2023]|uniref:lipocalin family protein n=1 Tax=unclassified Tamlana TaxID=2614803 RepID=UPI0026E2B391|nr:MULTISPECIES: lipocalin family protein [unclassified Tamlana]MDO6759845.1 lipocalin family protein [Tamlana sp. 2_MG-2023]MDO6791468.1 lipocalin family protein [Tamlana sp. 1_MG-2023]
MKKIVLVLLTLSLVACGSTKTATPEPKKVIKGDWTLSTISYSEAGEFDVTLLNEDTKECFEGSTWNFIPNNNTGSYSIEGADCNSGMRHFIFTIQKIDEQSGLYDFLLKPTDEKGKSMTNQGFRLKLTSISETSMVWEQHLTVDDEPFVITWQFGKY